MSLFCKNKDVGVQSFLLKLVNNHCPDWKVMTEDPRVDRRVDMVVVVTIIPVDDKRPQVRRAFTAVTKEFSNTGVSVVVEGPSGFDQAILGFRLEGRMTFALAQVKHLSPMGGGFFQLGFRMTEIVSAGDYPELEAAGF